MLLESDYNPFADLQAMDRAHRIGQDKPVNVYRLLVKDSIEEKIMQIQKTKMAMSDAIVNTENSTMFSMGTDRLLDIFTFRSDQEGQNNKAGGGGTGGLDDNDIDLDVLVERFGEEYHTLSVTQFLQGFRDK